MSCKHKLHRYDGLLVRCPECGELPDDGGARGATHSLSDWRTGDDFDRAKAHDVLYRGGVCPTTICALETDRDYHVALEVLSERWTDACPDATWWRDFFSLSHEHFILIDEGWVPAWMNDPDVTGEEPMEVLAEVNAPQPV